MTQKDSRYLPETDDRFSISGRRYLGSKTALLPTLFERVTEICGTFQSFCDPFGGTGVVAHRFAREGLKIIAGDLLLCNVVPMRAFLLPSNVEASRFKARLDVLNALEPVEDNYFSTHFGQRYFSLPVARKIGAIRERLARWLEIGELTPDEHDMLLTSLLYATDRIAWTCGHYDAYRPHVPDTQRLMLLPLQLEPHLHPENSVLLSDANALVKNTTVDVLYLDPPYNSRQYCDTYHLLENLTRWTLPAVEGKARKMPRVALKSRYNSRVDASQAMLELVLSARSRFIVISYNNMGKKGHLRSNACISDQQLRQILSLRGQVTEIEVAFRPFSAGKRRLEGHTERLFICRVER